MTGEFTGHDPFAGYTPRGAAGGPVDVDGMLRAGGADPAEVDDLRGQINDGQAQALRQGPLAAVRDLVRTHRRSRYDPTGRTVEDVKRDVAADPELARRALDVERDGKARTTLLTHLEDLVSGLEQAYDGNVPDREATAKAAERQNTEAGTAGPYQTFDTAQEEVEARQAGAADEEHPQEVIDAAERHGSA